MNTCQTESETCTFPLYSEVNRVGLTDELHHIQNLEEVLVEAKVIENYGKDLNFILLIDVDDAYHAII